MGSRVAQEGTKSQSAIRFSEACGRQESAILAHPEFLICGCLIVFAKILPARPYMFAHEASCECRIPRFRGLQQSTVCILLVRGMPAPADDGENTNAIVEAGQRLLEEFVVATLDEDVVELAASGDGRSYVATADRAGDAI